jgi:hypothetical protein
LHVWFAINGTASGPQFDHCQPRQLGAIAALFAVVSRWHSFGLDFLLSLPLPALFSSFRWIRKGPQLCTTSQWLTSIW